MSRPTVVVLAAGQGTRLRPLTDDRPKAMVELAGRPLVDWTLGAAARCGLDVVAVGGYRIDRLRACGVRVVENPDFATTSMVGTLMAAEPYFGEGFVMSYGDIVYRPEVLEALLASPAEIGVVVDLEWRPYWERRFTDPLADAESLRLRPDGTIASIGQRPGSIDEIEAQYIGLVAFRGRGVEALRAVWRRAQDDAAAGRPILGVRASLARLWMTDVLHELATAGPIPVSAVPIRGGWAEIDSRHDLEIAAERAASW